MGLLLSNIVRIVRLASSYSATAYVRVFVCAFILYASSPVVVLGQDGLTLDAAVQYALEHSPVMEKETLEQKKTAVDYAKEGSAFLPDIRGYVRYQHYFSDLPVYIFPEEEGAVLSGGASDGPYPVQLGQPHNMDAGISLSQVVFDNTMFLMSKFRPEKEKLDDLKMANVRNELVFNISSGYYRIAMLENKRQVIDYNLSRLERLKGMVQLQVENSFATESELLKLDVRLFELLTSRRKLNNGIEVQKNYLKLMMGMDHADTLLIRVRGVDAPPDFLIHGDTASRNLERQILEQQQVLLELQKRTIRSGNLPQLNLFARLNYQGQRSSWNFFSTVDPWYAMHYWGIQLDIPVMQGLAKRHDLQLADIRSSQLQLGLDQARKQQQIEIEQAQSELALNQQVLEDQRAHLEMAQELFDQAELKYEEGTIMLRDYLDAEALHAESRINYNTQQYQVILAALHLMKTKGTLLEFIKED